LLFEMWITHSNPVRITIAALRNWWFRRMFIGSDRYSGFNARNRFTSIRESRVFMCCDVRERLTTVCCVCCRWDRDGGLSASIRSIFGGSASAFERFGDNQFRSMIWFDGAFPFWGQ
jgi:hypothetical protein